MQVSSEEDGFVTVWLGIDAFLLQDTASERHPWNATISPALPAWAQATIHSGSHPGKRQEDCSACSGLAVLLGVFPTMEHFHGFTAQTKMQWCLRDFTDRHYITQPICVYGRLPECICAIPNLHTVELHVCTQLPAFKPLSKGAQ